MLEISAAFGTRAPSLDDLDDVPIGVRFMVRN
jgi:hypothetical protein